MNAKELGNRPASETTYRQWLVGTMAAAVIAGYMANKDSTSGEAPDAYAEGCEIADSILAREAQEAGDER